MVKRDGHEARALKAAAPARRPRTRDPEASKRVLLEAATQEFATKGLKGARIDAIAAAAGVNKQLVYHYFGDKDALYLRVLEEAYGAFRAVDRTLDLPSMDPVSALRHLIRDNVERQQRQRHFAMLVIDENFHEARHVARSRRLKALHANLVRLIGDLLRRGHEQGVFRAGIDPLQLYVSIASLSAIYITNRHTMRAVFGKRFDAIARTDAIAAHIEELVLRLILAEPPRSAASSRTKRYGSP